MTPISKRSGRVLVVAGVLLTLLVHLLTAEDAAVMPEADRACERLLERLPAWGSGESAPRLDDWYVADLGFFRMAHGEGQTFTRAKHFGTWHERMLDVLGRAQRRDTDVCHVLGSWDPQDDRWGFEGGRVYAAAINALTLEVYYRYENVFGVAQKK